MSKQEHRRISDALDSVKSSQQANVSDDKWRSNLEAFLAAQPEITGPVECKDIQQPKSGASSGKILFSATADFGEGRETRKLFLRYTLPTGIFGSYHCNIPAQFEIQNALADANLPVAKALYLDAAGKYLGQPGYAMECMSGRVATEDHFHSEPIAGAKPEEKQEMILNIVRFLAKAHAIDWQAKGLGFLQSRGDGKTCIERDFSWYVTAGKILRPDLVELLGGWQEWIVANQPEERSVVFCHLDSHVGNYMFQESGTGIVSGLDWEMSSLNQREADIAYLGMLNENMLRGQQIEGIPTTSELFAEYEKLTGYSCENRDFYRAYSLARLAIIFRLAIRGMTIEQQEASRSSWGWFEDNFIKMMTA